MMLIDLARNDVGRVCLPGSVGLTANMVVERFSHVMHIVSEVVGTPRRRCHGRRRDSALHSPRERSAAHPSTGDANHSRARARRPRNLRRRCWLHHAGAGAPGDLDLAIAIRTVVCRDGRFEVTAGAGIVEASVPAPRRWKRATRHVRR